MFIFQFIILIYSVILHEISHGWVADRLGDPSARVAGRLTLDPRPHIDPLMTVALPLILILSGSPVIIGGAKPVPIDYYNFRNPKKDISLVSAAGPGANILIAFAAAIIAKIAGTSGIGLEYYPVIAQLIYFTVSVNLLLAIFNLLPIPPLDGFHLVGILLPVKYAYKWYTLERYGFLFLILILFFFTPVFINFLNAATSRLTSTLISSPLI